VQRSDEAVDDLADLIRAFQQSIQNVVADESKPLCDGSCISISISEPAAVRKKRRKSFGGLRP